MAATYPAGVKSFSAVVNGTTKLVAALFNSPYEEITAIETALAVCLNTDGKVISTGLKTATYEASGTDANADYTITGGAYCHWPQVKNTSGSNCQIYVLGNSGRGANPGTTYITKISMYTAGGDTVYSQFLYHTASGTDHWIFLLVDKFTKEIIGATSAPDHPAYGNGGDFNKLPHPFLNYDATKHDVVILDQDTCNTLKEMAKDKSVLELINNGFKVDLSTEEVYKPLHSGKFLKENKDGKEVQIREMVASIPEYIKVRKLIALTDEEKAQKAILKQQAREQYLVDKAKDDLIANKQREIAIAELKKEGKL